ncbi:MAG: TIGR02757 family protein [Cytophagales bacterium]
MEFVNQSDLKYFLDEMVEKYNRPQFIVNDPISIPHLFSKKEDIEIMGFWSAILAWGQRVTIINKSKELISLMDGSPHAFITQHSPSDLKRFEKFVHRTFSYTDTLYFIHFLKDYYVKHASLEWAFANFLSPEDQNIENGLVGFHRLFFSLPDFPDRTQKHIATPTRKSACKRINMFLRWMVRDDANGVDFGIWKAIKPSQLVCPCDLHVDRVARKLGLINRTQTDWTTAVELTKALKQFDKNDPVKYDFALFGMGIEEKY